MLEECSARVLRHWAVRATLIGVGYCYREVFRQLEEDPLRITQGDLDTNLDALAVREGPIRDLATHRLRHLLDVGT